MRNALKPLSTRLLTTGCTERNHNIRIPGFSSDETRLAISHSNPATGGMASKAAKVDVKTKTTEGGDKDKGAKESKKSKSKAKETQTGGLATRAARLTAVRALK